MQQTVLLCDLCPQRKRFAVAKVELRFDGGKPVAIDLCQVHRRKVVAVVLPTATGRPSKEEAARRAQTVKARAAALARHPRRNTGPSDPQLQQALLALLARNRARSLARPDMRDKVPGSWSSAQRALMKLRAEKLVTVIGKMKHTRYQITPKGVGWARRKKSSRRARGAEAAPKRRGSRRSTQAQGSSGAAREAGRQESASTG